MCLCKKNYFEAQKTHPGAFLSWNLSWESQNFIEAGIGRRSRPPKLLLAKPAVWIFSVATKWLFEKNRGYKNAKILCESTIQAIFLPAT